MADGYDAAQDQHLVELQGIETGCNDSNTHPTGRETLKVSSLKEGKGTTYGKRQVLRGDPFYMELNEPHK